MSVAINLVVHDAVCFSVFDSQNMRKLVMNAKKGAGDYSKQVINAENVKKSLKLIASLKKDEIQKSLRGKIVNLSADFATCERRQFLGS